MLIRLGHAIRRAFSSDEISFKGRLDFEAQPRAFIEKFEKHLSKKKGKDTTLTVNLEEVDFIYPSTLIFLFGLLDVLKELNIYLQLKITEKSAIHEYMVYCGFSNFFRVPELPEDFEPTLKREGLLPLEKSDNLKNTESKAEWFINQFGDFDNKFIADARDATDEVLQNIRQHSEYSEYLLMGQYHPKSTNVRLCMFDNGIGIKKHLTRHSYAKQHKAFKKEISKSRYSEISGSPANYAIEAAAMYCVSATKYEENSGAGINYIIKDFSEPYHGTVTIVSQNGFVQWKEGKKKLVLYCHLN